MSDFLAPESDEFFVEAVTELSPRHRRLAQLAASGLTNNQICEQLGYSVSRVSILLKNPLIAAEIRRMQDRIFEEDIKTRLKSMSDAALSNIQTILTDRSGRVRVSEKADMSKWLVEKLDGKAAQKHDIGENMLGLLLDKLDANQSIPNGDNRGQAIDVTPLSLNEAPTPPRERTEEDDLADWVNSFDSSASGV